MEIPRIALKRRTAYTLNSRISRLVLVGKVLHKSITQNNQLLFYTNKIALGSANIYINTIRPGNVISIFIVSAIFYIQCHTVQRYFGITKGTTERKCHKMEFKQFNVQ